MNILSEFLKTLLFVFSKYPLTIYQGNVSLEHNLLETCESPGMSRGPRPTVSLSMDSVIHGQPCSKNTD